VPKVQVEVPAGMTPEQLLALVTSYEEKRVKGGARNKARHAADKFLREKYKAEYEAQVKAAMPKAA
jgi:hypothetical protein